MQQYILSFSTRDLEPGLTFSANNLEKNTANSVTLGTIKSIKNTYASLYNHALHVSAAATYPDMIMGFLDGIVFKINKA